MKTRLNPHFFIRCFFAILLLYLPLAISAQLTKKYPQHYFRWPLDLRPEIVANMGELRSNHWHMGLDIRTAQKVNQRVYAAAEGYIAYVGIRPFSYGRFIMINHPNGLTTLYAHLNDFNPELEKYVTRQQYEQESWATELTLPPDQFPVKKGDFIAFSGTTGGSQGPHVHFEIRDTETGKCLNPLLFGMPLSDNVRPGLVRLALYDRNTSVYEQAPRLFQVKYAAGKYSVYPAALIKTGSDKVSFGIEAYDQISGSPNRDGIYSAKLFVDGQLQSGFTIDSIDYNNTRYMNAQIDYSHREKGGSYIQHLSRMPGDWGGVYHASGNDGVIKLKDKDIHKIKIRVSDAYGNHTELDFSIQYVPGAAKAARPADTAQALVPGFVNVVEKPAFEVYFPEDCLYDTVIPANSYANLRAPGALSARHKLNDATIPLHSHVTVRIKPDADIPAEWRETLLIKRTHGRDEEVKKAEWQGDWVAAKFNELGSFQVFADTEPPVINDPGSGELFNLSAASRITFTPKDNFGIKRFRAELDGKWLRFTNDKGRSWIYIFDERCPPGVHELKVTVEDLAGNTTTKTWQIKR